MNDHQCHEVHILFRTIPLNKTAKERGVSLSNVCCVFVRWRGGQINVLSVHTPPQCSLSQWKIPLAQDVQWSTLLELCSMWTMLGSSFVLPNQSCHYFDNSFRWWSFKDPHSIPGYKVDKLQLFGGKHDFFASPLTKNESESVMLQEFSDPSPLSPLYSNRGIGVAFLESTHSLSQLSVAVIANSRY